MPAVTIQQALDLARKYHSTGQLQHAETICRQVVAHAPSNLDAHLLLSHLLLGSGRVKEAIAVLKQSLLHHPNSAALYNNLAGTLQENGELDAAIDAFTRAIQLDPTLAASHFNLGLALANAFRINEAIDAYRSAIRVQPQFPEAFNGLGNALKSNRKVSEAIAAYRQAILQKSDFAIAHVNLSHALLLTGAFHEGWLEQEWRFKVPEMAANYSTFSQPQWRGEEGKNKTIFLYTEQGFGDSIQFCRYASLVSRYVGTVVVACPPELKRVMQSLEGVKHVVTHGDAIPAFDVQSSLLSLPYIFDTNLETIPATVPYLRPDPTLVSNWNERIKNRRKKLNIGIAWSGSQTNRQGIYRSLSLDDLVPLSQIDDVAFFSLQKNAGQSAQAHLRAKSIDLIDLSDKFTDFAETAALIANLDLVITIDTAVAHLAGAMGIPTWVMLPFAGDWRWMLDRNDSPWYPTVKLVRQQESANWHEVVKTIRECISK